MYDWQRRWERPALKVALKLAHLAATDRLVDVAAGTGAFLREVASSLSTKLPRSVVAVDRSAAMLQRASDLPGDWKFIQADATALPLPDNAADVVVSTYLLHLIGPRQRRAVLREIHRVLVVGGRLVVVTPLPVNSGVAQRRAWVGAWLADRCPGWFAGLRPLDPRADLEQCGFLVTHAVSVQRGYPSLCVRATRLN